VRVIQALGALAAELEAGQPPRVALRRAGGEPSVWPVAHAAIDMDGGVADALGVDAREHGVLRQLAACWQVGADTGAGLAASVGRLAAAARAAEDVRVDLEGQLAGPRSTARMLAVLPLVGIGFGMMLGSDPLVWLVGTLAGRVCLLTGVLLTALGMWWTGRIAARVERLL
jgi:tight adherence protein B